MALSAWIFSGIKANAHNVAQWRTIRQLLREELGEGVDVEQIHFCIAGMCKTNLCWQDGYVLTMKSSGLSACTSDHSAGKHQQPDSDKSKVERNDASLPGPAHATLLLVAALGH